MPAWSQPSAPSALSLSAAVPVLKGQVLQFRLLITLPSLNEDAQARTVQQLLWNSSTTIVASRALIAFLYP